MTVSLDDKLTTIEQALVKISNDMQKLSTFEEREKVRIAIFDTIRELKKRVEDVKVILDVVRKTVSST